MVAKQKKIKLDCAMFESVLFSVRYGKTLHQAIPVIEQLLSRLSATENKRDQRWTKLF